MAVETKLDENGKTLYHKVCACSKCGAEFWGSRKAKYCILETCKTWGRDQNKKVQKRRKHARDVRNEDVDLFRIKCTCHSVARAILKHEARGEECEQCGSAGSLEVHHLNVNWLDNRVENLKCLCVKCHAQAHSELAKATVLDKK